MKKVLGLLSVLGGVLFLWALTNFAISYNGEMEAPEYAMIASALLGIIGFIGYPIFTRFWKN